MQLRNLEGGLKAILFSLTLILCVGTATGIAYMTQSVGTNPHEIQIHYNGDPIPAPTQSVSLEEESIEEIPENIAMEQGVLLSVIHSHVSSFALIFGCMGILVWFTRLPKTLKLSLALEPLWGTAITFGSIWLMRFVHPDFVWLTIISGTIMYGCFFIATISVWYELCQKSESARTTTL